MDSVTTIKLMIVSGSYYTRPILRSSQQQDGEQMLSIKKRTEANF